MERFFLLIAFVCIFIIIILSFKSVMRWTRALALYGPAFVVGKHYLRASLPLSDEILSVGLECCRQMVETLMKINLSYKLLKVVDVFVVIWNDRWTYVIAREKGTGRWCIRYVPDMLERVNGSLDLALGALYHAPEVSVSGIISMFGLIDISGLTYMQKICIDNISNRNLHIAHSASSQ